MRWADAAAGDEEAALAAMVGSAAVDMRDESGKEKMKGERERWMDDGRMGGVLQQRGEHAETLRQGGVVILSQRRNCKRCLVRGSRGGCKKKGIAQVPGG